MHRRRNRIVALLATAGIATALASPAAAVTVRVERNTLEFAEAILGDIETRVGDLTIVTLSEFSESNVPVLAYDHSDFAAITCDDGSEGLSGPARSGLAEYPDIAFDRHQLAFARASATIEVTDYLVDTCEQTMIPTGSATIEVSLDLEGSGPIVHDAFISKSGIPGFFLQRWPEILAYRGATGEVVVDGVTTTVSATEGFIGFSRGINHVIEH